MLLEELASKNLINPPGFVRSNTQYLTVMGSEAYGVATDHSDFDLYGWCIPPKDMIFPNLRGEIPGFGTQQQRFEQWQKHHIDDPNAHGGKGQEYDLTIFSIVKFFNLAMQNNPNALEALFVPQECILFSTQVGQMVREARKKFLHKGVWFRMKGFSYAQLKKMKSTKRTGKRKSAVERDSFDVKFALHVVRLLNECEQILTTGDLDLRRDREMLKAIRRGDWTLGDIEKYFADKEKTLEKVYNECTILPHSPRDRGLEENIKTLLLNCLEEAYGSLDGALVCESEMVKSLRRIQAETESALRKVGG